MVEMTESSVVNIKIDISELTLGDVETMTTAEAPFAQKMEVLKRIVVEGDPRKIRIKDMPLINDMIEREMERIQNPTLEASPSSPGS
jgi:hypothetical protein